MKKPELLAPAGNWESLVAAIEAGCDAVYLSGKLYGARSYAGNFDNEEIICALNYAHKYGVKIYITVNTIIYESEVNNFIEYVNFLYVNGVDAIIIQDIGMFDLIRKKFPNLEIHISTQMHIHNLEGAKIMEQLGAKRIVLARETPIDLVEKIKKNTNIEIEIFIHGALCISYSGQCLMSSLIGGRSGNRGTCAQCCRQPYELISSDGNKIDSGYLLSTKDLNTLNNIGKLIELGVDSLKIEGRLKRPEYVYLVVKTYRKAIDNYIKYKDTKITEDDITELKKIFNRKYTKGFLFNSTNKDIINTFRPNHIGIEIGRVISVNKQNVDIELNNDLNVLDGIRCIGKKDIGLTIQSMYIKRVKVSHASKKDIITIKMNEQPKIGDIVVKTTDYNQLKNIQNSINSNSRKVNIKFKLIAHLNSQLILKVDDGINNIELKDNYIVQMSKNVPTTIDSIEKQLTKTGNTVYNVEKIECELDDNIFIPIKNLNELRRNILEQLDDLRTKKNEIVYGEYNVVVANYPKEKNINLYVQDKKMINRINLEDYNEIICDEIIDTNKFRLKIPRVQENLKDYSNNLLIGEWGSIYKYSTNDICTDFSFNVVNSYSVAFLHSLGVKRVTLSHELNDYQIKKIIDNYHKRYNKHPNLELIISDVPEAMILKYDLLNGKYNSKMKYYLRDKYKNKYEVKRSNDLTYIYNYKPIIRESENYYFDMGINNVRKNSINL